MKMRPKASPLALAATLAMSTARVLPPPDARFAAPL